MTINDLGEGWRKSRKKFEGPSPGKLNLKGHPSGKKISKAMARANTQKRMCIPLNH